MLRLSDIFKGIALGVLVFVAIMSLVELIA
jgi:hypothetical protein